MTFRIGLTGGMASGKSTVARLLAEGGATVIDADRVVAGLYGADDPGTELVRDLFGDEYIAEDGSVDRPALGRRVFQDDLARRRLERGIWPLVRRRFEERATAAAEAGAELVVLEATLLVEAGFAGSFDLVVSVEAPEEVRLARAVERGLSEEEARARLKAQGNGEARRAGADLVLDNAGSLEQLEEEVAGLLDELRAGKFGGGRRPGGASAAAAPDSDALPSFIFVTGNPHKVEEAERALGRTVEAAPLDLPEIQSLNLVSVLRAKAAEAWQRLGAPVVVEDTSLELDALNGFPGPLVKWLLEAVGPEGVARQAHALDDARVVTHCAILYKAGPRPEDEVVAHGRVAGRLVLPPRGEGGFGWDPVVVPEGAGGRTLAELAASDEGKEAYSCRAHAWLELARMLATLPGRP